MQEVKPERKKNEKKRKDAIQMREHKNNYETSKNNCGNIMLQNIRSWTGQASESGRAMSLQLRE